MNDTEVSADDVYDMVRAYADRSDAPFVFVGETEPFPEDSNAVEWSENLVNVDEQQWKLSTMRFVLYLDMASVAYIRKPVVVYDKTAGTYDVAFTCAVVKRVST